MMRVKTCLWLTLFILILFVSVIYIFRRSDKMGSILSSSKSDSSSADLSVADHIQQLIQKYPVMVFSKSYCPYSRKAKDVLSKYKLNGNYHVLELDQISKTDEYQNELGKLTGARTVPRVFISGKCIGGGDDTSALDKNGDLQRLLKEAKALVD